MPPKKKSVSNEMVNYYQHIPKKFLNNVPNPQLPIRYLGVMIGNNVPLDIGWTRISDKLSQEVKRVLSNKWISLTTRILHINAVVCSKYTYPISHTFTPPTSHSRI